MILRGNLPSNSRCKEGLGKGAPLRVFRSRFPSSLRSTSINDEGTPGVAFSGAAAGLMKRGGQRFFYLKNFLSPITDINNYTTFQGRKSTVFREGQENSFRRAFFPAFKPKIRSFYGKSRGSPQQAERAPFSPGKRPGRMDGLERENGLFRRRKRSKRSRIVGFLVESASDWPCGRRIRLKTCLKRTLRDGLRARNRGLPNGPLPEGFRRPGAGRVSGGPYSRTSVSHFS